MTPSSGLAGYRGFGPVQGGCTGVLDVQGLARWSGSSGNTIESERGGREDDVGFEDSGNRDCFTTNRTKPFNHILNHSPVKSISTGGGRSPGGKIKIIRTARSCIARNINSANIPDCIVLRIGGTKPVWRRVSCPGFGARIVHCQLGGKVTAGRY